MAVKCHSHNNKVRILIQYSRMAPPGTCFQNAAAEIHVPLMAGALRKWTVGKMTV
jgi:hypothetical protein